MNTTKDRVVMAAAIGSSLAGVGTFAWACLSGVTFLKGAIIIGAAQLVGMGGGALVGVVVGAIQSRHEADHLLDKVKA